MRLLVLRSLIASLILVAGNASEQPQYIPGAYLVEFKDNHDEQTFTTNLQSKRLLASPRVTISSNVFNGASYQFDPAKLGRNPKLLLYDLPSVKNVWPVEVIKKPNDEIAWKGSNPTSIPAQIKKHIARNDTGFSPHIMTQVDKLRAEGITGKGIKIGIVDDGVDYKHPALGGCFGEGCLVARGYDHIGENFSIFAGYAPKAGPDPYTNCEGHGTHVSGTIAAQENKYGFTGAAPGVELGMYKVFSCGGDTTNDIVAQGISKAYEDGNHIITASLGKRSGWSEDPLAVLAERIIEKGVVCTFAQGNSGTSGPFNPEAPGTAKGAIAVASIGNTELPRVFLNATYAVNNGTTVPFGWTYGQPDNWGNISLPIAIGDDATTSCDEFANVTDLSGHIALIKSVSACSDWYKSTFAAKKGAEYVLFYITSSEATDIVQLPIGDLGSRYPLPKAVGMIPAATAQEFIRSRRSGQEVTVQITDPKFANQYIGTAQYPAGGYLSAFTTWGPSWELDMKPDVAAPGGFILSTFPTTLGSYAVISGTSMATPLTAGIFALIMEARGKLTVNELRNILASTSKPIAVLNGTSPLPDLAPVHQQGSGMAQVWDAAHANGVLSTNKLLLNDTEHFVESHNFTLRNTGSKDITYALGHLPAFTVYSLNDGGRTIATASQLRYSRQYANATFAQSSITIQGGSEATVTVSITPPDGLEATRLPVYSGYITLDGSNGERLSIPYLGVVGSMRKTTPFSDFYISRSDTNPVERAAPATQFILPKTNNANTTVRFVAPTIVGNLAFGTRYFDLQVYSVTNTNTSSNATASLDKNFGSLPDYPVPYMPRVSQYLESWRGELKNGSRVPEGNYAFVGRALKIFGDESKEEDWNVVRSVDFSLIYA